MRQSWYDSATQIVSANATITGNSTTSTPAVVFANTLANSTSSVTYLTYMATQNPSFISADGSVGPYLYTTNYGNLTVSGNTTLVDILLVGAGGPGYGGTHGSSGGTVSFYSNVKLLVGVYNIGVSSGSGGSSITIGSDVISVNDGTGSYVTTGSPTGGAGAGGAQSSGIGGVGLSISKFGSDLTWLTSNGTAYFGAGGGGATTNFAGDNNLFSGGYQGAGEGGNLEGYSPDQYTIQIGLPNFGGGAGAGAPGYNDYTGPVVGGSGIVIIRHVNTA